MTVLVSGTSNTALAEKVATLLGMPLHPVDIRRFSDGEIYVELSQTVRGEEIFLLQSTSRGHNDSVNDHLMELILLVSACRRASAQSITAVIPYYGYARSDRLSKKRTTIAAADVAKILVSMGVDRVVCVELHAGQIEGFFGGNVAVDDLDSTSTFVNNLPRLLKEDFPTEQNESGLVVVSPDAGGVARAKRFRNKCEQLYKNNTKGWEPTGLAIIVKHRTKPNEVASMDLVGNVAGKVCVLVDDMCDTAGTLLKAASMLRANGAKAVYACIAHGLLSGPACDRLSKDAALTKLCVLDTIGTVTACQDRLPNKIEVCSSAPILARAIDAIASHRSLSTAVDLANTAADSKKPLLLARASTNSKRPSKL
jgi:ribose-phosphate pyrophosphokinase